MQTGEKMLILGVVQTLCGVYTVSRVIAAAFRPNALHGQNGVNLGIVKDYSYISGW
ncbi:MAG: hypothetical protein K2I96_24410 [Lachnospiraceae bacterium]|nr:hypothetical protein [Lachnospiraceae bacterium]